MTDPQKNKLRMYFAVLAACEKHQVAWQTLLAFVTHHTLFSAAAETQQTGITGATRDKSKRREIMADLAVPLQTWALVNKQNQLAAEVAFTRSSFFYEHATDSERNARKVHTEAAARIADLADYGVDQPIVDALDTAIIAYHEAIVSPRGANIDRKAATAALAEGFSKADELLNKRLDKLIPILATAQPAFATDYRNARIIVDTGSRSTGASSSSSSFSSSSSSSGF